MRPSKSRQPTGAFLRRFFQGVVLFFPGALLLGFLSTWMAARLSLGHWPRPSLDDPKEIGLFVDIPHYATTLLVFFGFPMFVFALAGVGFIAVSEPGERRRLIAVSGIGLTGMFLSILVLRSDPFAIVDWFLD